MKIKQPESRQFFFVFLFFCFLVVHVVLAFRKCSILCSFICSKSLLLLHAWLTHLVLAIKILSPKVLVSFFCQSCNWETWRTEDEA